MNTLVTAILLGLLALVSTQASADTIYKWKDAQGGIHYTSDPPPKGAKVQSVVLPSANTVSSQAPGRAYPVNATPVARESRAEPVTLYGASWCGYCRAARQHLNQRGIPFTDIDVDSDPGKAEFAAIGGHGIPVILVGSARMSGYSEQQLDAMLKANGW